MDKQTKRVYEFGRFCLDCEDGLLLRDGKPVYLKPKVFETLVVLVENRGRVLDKETLMRRLWQDAFVEEANLTVNISQLRKALGMAEDGSPFIETLPRRGYRFVADVREVWTEEAALVIKEYNTARITIEEHESDGEGEARPVAFAAPLAEAAGPRLKAAGLNLFGVTLTRRVLAFALAVALLVAVAAVTTVLLRAPSPDRRESRAAAPAQAMEVTQLTTTGKVAQAAISPDGKYVAYAVSGGGGQSLWVLHVPTAASLQLISAAEILYLGLTFTPDGNYVRYVRAEKNGTKGALYEVALIGQASKKVLDDVSSAVSFSPDGRRFVFVREEEREAALVIANADGSGEQRLAARANPDAYEATANGPSWSPDGRLIACFTSGHNGEKTFSNLVLVRAEDGEEEKTYPDQWDTVGGLAWQPDGGGLILVASEEAPYQQVWHLSYPAGELRRITSDVNGYLGVGLTADAGALVTMHRSVVSSIWIAPDGKADSARKISPGLLDGRNGFAWTPDGRLVYTTKTSGRKNVDIFVMDADGGNAKPLTTDSGMNYAPAVTPDGRQIVFVSDRSGRYNIWKMDSNGENPQPLTHGVYDYEPQCTPDGRWVVFVREDGDKPMIWKVPIEGGEAVQVVADFATSPAISPDGRLLACNSVEAGGARYRTAIIPMEGGRPLKFFDLPPGIAYQSFIHWTADGRALTYAGIRGNAKVWLQPLDGGPPKELTDFKTDSIWYFDWSRDGKSLAVALGGPTSDVTLIRNFK